MPGTYFAADQLPHSPEKSLTRASIMNTDETSKPGTHWLAIFTKDYKCEVFDSYGLPMNWYKSSEVVSWIYNQFDNIRSNAVSLQEIKSQYCGQYALMCLKFKARGKIMHDFVSEFKRGDYVHNDHLVGEMIKPLLDWRVKFCKSCKQSHLNPCYLDI